MATRAPDATRARLLQAAAELFAAQGFHGTTVREIADRAGVNLAAGNYYFGSKKALYLEVFRDHFRQITTLLAEHGAARTPQELSRLDRDGLRALLHTRIRLTLELLIGPPPGLHGTLMQREMCDPSEALPLIVSEFIRPMTREMEDIVRHLEPSFDTETVERCTRSMIGQVLFYRFCMPGILRMMGRRAYTPAITAELADHIATFSEHAMTGMAAAPRRRTQRAR